MTDVIQELKNLRARNRMLEEENQALKAEKRELVAEIEGTAHIYVGDHFGLSTQESRVLALLIAMTGKLVTRELMYSRLYDRSKSLPMPKVFEVYICNMRRKLRPYGISIETLHGRGYMLHPDYKKRLDTIVAAKKKGESNEESIRTADNRNADVLVSEGA